MGVPGAVRLELYEDLHIEEEGGEIIFRTKLRLSFKYDVAHAHVHQ